MRHKLTGKFHLMDAAEYGFCVSAEGLWRALSRSSSEITALRVSAAITVKCIESLPSELLGSGCEGNHVLSSSPFSVTRSPHRRAVSLFFDSSYQCHPSARAQLTSARGGNETRG